MSSKARRNSTESPNKFVIQTIPPGFLASVRLANNGPFVRSALWVVQRFGRVVSGGLQYGIGMLFVFLAFCIPGIVQQFKSKPAADLAAVPASAKFVTPLPSVAPPVLAISEAAPSVSSSVAAVPATDVGSAVVTRKPPQVGRTRVTPARAASATSRKWDKWD